MINDSSNGYEAIARQYMASRTSIGLATVRAWAATLPSGCALLDVGAGHGWPLAEALSKEGFMIHAVEPSPTLAAAFALRLPSAPIACETAEESAFFGRRFPGVMAIGLLFLLPASAQEALINRLAAALEPGGRLLFTAPWQACAWPDLQTGRASQSLGAVAYGRLLRQAGLHRLAPRQDEGGNLYFEAIKPP